MQGPDADRNKGNDMAEARHSERARSLLGAQIYLNNRQSTIECQIRNISAKGAKLVIADTIAVPEEFEINIPQKGRTFNARVIWRTPRESGIEFIAAPAAEEAPEADAPDEAYRRIRSLEAENAALRKKIVELQYRLERWSESL